VVAGLILIATTAAAMAVVPHARQAVPANERQTRAAESSRYMQWLDGPVSYIITPGEREAFEKLTTGEERDLFVRQFWERRNPTPGSRTNTFKEEFYRRVAYTNAHFSAGYPGWKSDRGHIYILYGPPDMIESHPSAAPRGYVDWMFQLIPGFGSPVFFRFIDQTGNGDFRLQSPPWKKP
jgi:GWxTD domain-containing protein